MSAKKIKDEGAPRVVAIIQARLGSTRFPRKVLSVFQGDTLLSIMIKRLRTAQTLDRIVLAIPENPQNDALFEHARDLGVDVSRGSEEDVLSRFFKAAEDASAHIVVRLTADCPLIDPAIVDECVQLVSRGDTRFAATSELFPDGLDVEVFRFELLQEAHTEATAPGDREHVTPYIRRNYAEELVEVEPKRELRPIRITLDEKEDLDVILGVLEVQDTHMFSAYDVHDLAARRPELFRANLHLTRNEGATMNSGQKMWRRAQKVIAGGNMLLSKRPDMHSPDQWPSYFSRAEGCRVWDLDGREFIDMGFMGVGTNILGYGHPKVDEAVRKAIDAGNLSTLNAPEEVELAERLIDLHPWADKARFTRSGGEAGAVAVRLARAATGRDRIVFCGYHGWHDWYLAANLSDDSNLDGHLLPGLAPGGVPRALAGTSVPFHYNDLESFRAAIAHGDVAAIVMEVERSTPPAPGFLEEIRRVATEIGAVLVFDECTSGFRKVLGGHHLTVGVNPDVAIFGKTLGNGYAINAVIGTEAVMSAIDWTFISSTFWTERIGSAAALATLTEMEAQEAPQLIDQLGQKLRGVWFKAGQEAELDIASAGLQALTTFSVKGVEPRETKQILVDSFLEDGFLAGPAVYLSVPHSNALGARYQEAVAKALQRVAEYRESGCGRGFKEPGLPSLGFSRLN